MDSDSLPKDPSRFLWNSPWIPQQTQDDGKGGLSLTGVAFMTVLAVLENTLPSFRWSFKIQDKEATVTVLTVRDGFDGFGGFDRDGYPP